MMKGRETFNGDHKANLNIHDQLYERQSGLKCNRSYYTVLNAIIYDLLSAIDQTEVVGIVLLYFCKAFVYHKILLD